MNVNATTAINNAIANATKAMSLATEGAYYAARGYYNDETIDKWLANVRQFQCCNGLVVVTFVDFSDHTCRKYSMPLSTVITMGNKSAREDRIDHITFIDTIDDFNNVDYDQMQPTFNCKCPVCTKLHHGNVIFFDSWGGAWVPVDSNDDSDDIHAFGPMGMAKEIDVHWRDYGPCQTWTCPEGWTYLC